MKKKPPVLGKTRPEIAFYYPGPVWYSGNWIKNLVLFFDGIGLLVPEYIKDKPFESDPAIAAGLEQAGLLHIWKPEKIIDKAATQKLARSMTDILSFGALNALSKENTTFHQLSYSRLGGYGDPELANAIFRDLKAMGLARDSEDGVSIPMHPLVRALVLVLLAQVLRPYGKMIGKELSPATDRPELTDALAELLSLPLAPSSGHVISSDLETVSVDLGPVPIAEVLSFRQEHYQEHRAYIRAVRQFVRDLSLLPRKEIPEAFDDRREELRDIAADLKRISGKAWKRPASFALSMVGAAWMLTTGDPIGAFLAAGAGILGGEAGREKGEIGAYSYLFKASQKFRS
jgi:hypothetical protein